MNSRVDYSQFETLQRNQKNIRNICILAHVDHGKTTLSDHLVSSNGLISQKLAGKLRFLDSTEEEQRRGITIHSSAISLLYKLDKKPENKNTSTSSTESIAEKVTSSSDYLINLIDCPGHIDFSSDVSTATRLCDGAIVLVDVLEGVCTQTRAVLHKALKERMRPCLVLNKIDRLCLEMKLSSSEAYQHLRKILENVNALSAQLVNSELKLNCSQSSGENSLDVNNMEEWIFLPEKGNVIFCSALDSWGFGIAKFANHWASKLSFNKDILMKYMFDEYTLLPNSKKIVKMTNEYSNSKPLFASLALDPIWAIYQTAIVEINPEKASKMAKRALDIDLQPKEINVKDPRSTAQAIFRKWLPISDSVLRMVVRCVPDPGLAQGKRVNTFYPDLKNNSKESIFSIRNSLVGCYNTDSIPENEDNPHSSTTCEVVVFVSKMMPVRIAEIKKTDLEMLKKNIKIRLSELDSNVSNSLESNETNESKDLRDYYFQKLEDLSSGEGEVMMALARIFCGQLDPRKDLYYIGNRYDPAVEQQNIVTVQGLSTDTIKKIPANSFALYLCLGPSILSIDRVPAGNIVGIIGLDSFISKTATLSSSTYCYPMKSITFQATPMVRVAIEPINHRDLKRIERGLQSLYQYDPAVEIGLDDSGQFTITCLGELHLEQCVKVLTEKFCKCELRASEPIVPFRETIINTDKNRTRLYALPPPWITIQEVERVINGEYKFISCGGQLGIHLRCLKLPDDAINLLETYNLSIRSSFDNILDRNWTDFFTSTVDFNPENEVFYQKLLDYFNESGLFRYANIQDLYKKILGYGKNLANSNLLLFSPQLKLLISHMHDLSILNTEGKDNFSEYPLTFTNEEVVFDLNENKLHLLFGKIWTRLHNAVIAGFQSAIVSGPLMQETIYGTVFVIEKIELSQRLLTECGFIDKDYDFLNLQFSNVFSDPSMGTDLHLGQLISDVASAMKVVFLASPVRLIEPIYSCELQCDQNQLGNLYAVLSKRRGIITSEDIIEGTSLFLISAFLPISESFGFAQELLEKTSGNAISPQLTFSHWEVLEIDPFWRPTTAQELEDHGALASEPNIARNFIDQVRRRKGLIVEEKTVVSAEKQRNLSKNK